MTIIRWWLMTYKWLIIWWLMTYTCYLHVQQITRSREENERPSPFKQAVKTEFFQRREIFFSLARTYISASYAFKFTTSRKQLVAHISRITHYKGIQKFFAVRQITPRIFHSLYERQCRCAKRHAEFKFFFDVNYDRYMHLWYMDLAA